VQHEEYDDDYMTMIVYISQTLIALMWFYYIWDSDYPLARKYGSVIVNCLFFLVILLIPMKLLVPGIILKCETIVAFFIVVLTILQLNFWDAPYILNTLYMFCIIIFLYYIMLIEKDTLLRESHVLSQKLGCGALKNAIKAHIQSIVKGAKYAHYLTSCLYFIFIILLLSVIFRLDFALQFSEMFDLYHFYKF